ncbi:MAG: efflux transporter outer membrane subunit [Burkholderiaceae bacterium]|jgi:NodT family efflux transporter outer membrane factor (OMF) lipoprotein|nr:efflux transporter outer membrane subunit [Burkholderiaceae bacterium]
MHPPPRPRAARADRAARCAAERTGRDAPADRADHADRVDRDDLTDLTDLTASPRRSPLRPAALLLASLALAGCALTPPGPAPAPDVAPAWIAPQPAAAHGGSSAQLSQWWSQFDDPLLAQLIDATQRNNGNLVQAQARIAQARANARIAGSGAWPALDARASATRARIEVPPPATLGTTRSIGLDTLWEIDVFGVTRNNVAAARARIDSAAAGWHDLRVSLAAETAGGYIELRACESLVDVYTQDAGSQKRTAELTQIKAGAGLESPANAALAAASAADASNRLLAQRAQCDAQVKSLVALTGLAEPALRTQLDARRARLPQPATFSVEAVPAQLLMQRPDLTALAREVLAASGEVGAAQADRWPRLSLAGTVSLASARSGGSTLDGTQWSIGPALSLPLFDAGRRAAQVDAARARYDEALARYTQRARDAVAEVERALVALDAATRRESDAQVAADGFRRFFDAAQARFDVGAESLLDLESARRNALLAAATLVGVQRERVAAWVALYRAVGGGFVPAEADVPVRVTTNESAGAPAKHALAR